MSLKNVTTLIAAAVLILGGCGGAVAPTPPAQLVNACIGVECAPPTACQNPGVCDPATGACTYSARPDGQDCDDGNVCTLSDRCEAGTCVGGTMQTCAAIDQCHGTGVCDPMTGCSNAALVDGTACDDGNLCTHGDACQAGTCAGAPLPCVSGDECSPTGQCNAGTGKCEYIAAPQGTACTLYAGTADATPSYCDAGVCHSTCAVGYTDCNHNLETDGCEVFTGGDPDNCGGCGVGCVPDNVAVPACTQGQCTGTCVPGYANCLGTAQNTGCQTSLLTDLLNCGGCGIPCNAAGADGLATSSCVNGTCSGTCSAGFGDCNSNIALDGCEANFDNDPKNCGQCGQVCPSAAPTCMHGNCYRGQFTIGEGPPASSNPICYACYDACVAKFGYVGTSGWDWVCSTVTTAIDGNAHYVEDTYNTSTNYYFKGCKIADGYYFDYAYWLNWVNNDPVTAFVNDPDPAYNSCRTLPNYCFAYYYGGGVQ